MPSPHDSLRAAVAAAFPDQLDAFDRWVPPDAQAVFWDTDDAHAWLLLLATDGRVLHHAHLTAEACTWRAVPVRRLVGLGWQEEPDATALTLYVAPPVGTTLTRATRPEGRAGLRALYEALARAL